MREGYAGVAGRTRCVSIEILSKCREAYKETTGLDVGNSAADDDYVGAGVPAWETIE